MEVYFESACELEAVVDNAVNRCFQFGDSMASIRRIVDHAFYLKQELALVRDSLRRCGTHSRAIDYGAQQCCEIFHDYCVILEDISTSRSPELLVARLQPDIMDFRHRLDVEHASLSRSIDEYENSMRAPRLPPFQPGFSAGGSAMIINSNAARRRLPPRLGPGFGRPPPGNPFFPPDNFDPFPGPPRLPPGGDDDLGPSFVINNFSSGRGAFQNLSAADRPRLRESPFDSGRFPDLMDDDRNFAYRHVRRPSWRDV